MTFGGPAEASIVTPAFLSMMETTSSREDYAD
jgi:hypothetical protein